VVITTDGKLVRKLEVPSSAAPNLAFSPDGTTIYVMAVDDQQNPPYKGKVYAIAKSIVVRSGSCERASRRRIDFHSERAAASHTNAPGRRAAVQEAQKAKVGRRADRRTTRKER
jgi:hypothetical protein